MAHSGYMKKYTLIMLLCAVATGNICFAQQAKAHINHTAIYVVDLKASMAFYQNIIGLDTIPEPFHDGKHAWFKTGPGISLHIIQGAEAKKEYYKNQHTCFSVASVDAFTKLLAAKNIPFEDVKGNKGAITNRVDGVKQLWLQDPDGYWIEINDAKD
jgi:lactoylglutathione lyase